MDVVIDAVMYGGGLVAGLMVMLFITKSFYAYLLIVASEMLGLEFPFLPRHGSLTALFTLGIPTSFISLTTPPPGRRLSRLRGTRTFSTASRPVASRPTSSACARVPCSSSSVTSRRGEGFAMARGRSP